MSTDDLTRPLELRLPGQGKAGRLAGPAGAGLAVLVVAGSLGYLIARGDPLGGEPHAIVRIDRSIKTGSVDPAKTPATQAETPQRPAKDYETAQEMEEVAGVRVIRGKGGQAPGSIVIRVPEQEAATKLAALDRRLSERGRHGMLPRMNGENAAPRTAYARPFDAAKAGSRPRIAVVMTGLGIGATATTEAISALPGEVSLAFAPYGTDLERQSNAARAGGHEILLQAPMEPYGYPGNDTGPHTLLSSASEAQNLDRLHWLMSRFPGYVGITNFMGAKFTETRPALKPVLDEAARRGLLFVDDGSSERSLVAEVAPTSRLPAARGDVVLDGLDRNADFDKAVARAEALARGNGQAIVFAPALPAMVERVNRWARGLEAKGFALAPVSALVRK